MLSLAEFEELLGIEPLLLEPGAEPMRLRRGQVEVEEKQPGSLRLYAWDAERSTSLLVCKVSKIATGHWELTARGLFGREHRAELIDPNRAALNHHRVRAVRDRYREQLARSIQRQFPGWQLREITTGANLSYSLSPAYPRAIVERGSTRWAALLCPPMSNVDHALTFGLIWHDHVRRRTPKHQAVEGLALFLPIDQHIPTALRLKYLDSRAFRCALYVYDAAGFEDPVEMSDSGNWLQLLEKPSDASEHTADQILRPADTPERRLEIAVRADLPAIDPGLIEPVYGQVPSFAARDRDLIDLLAAGSDGRLCVLELKATEDPHLPLQGLDYWLRVKYHLEQQTFQTRGYFPGRRLLPISPRLYFVAPALRFHSSNGTVLRYFSTDIEVERVGVAERFDKGIRVVFRDNEHSYPGSTGDCAPQAVRGPRNGGKAVPHRALRRA